MITSTWKPLIATDPIAAVRREIDRLGYVQVGLEMRDDGAIEIEQGNWVMPCHPYDLWDALQKISDDQIPPCLFAVAQPARKPW